MPIYKGSCRSSSGRRSRPPSRRAWSCPPACCRSEFCTNINFCPLMSYHRPRGWIVSRSFEKLLENGELVEIWGRAKCGGQLNNLASKAGLMEGLTSSPHHLRNEHSLLTPVNKPLFSLAQWLSALPRADVCTAPFWFWLRATRSWSLWP